MAHAAQLRTGTAGSGHEMKAGDGWKETRLEAQALKETTADGAAARGQGRMWRREIRRRSQMQLLRPSMHPGSLDEGDCENGPVCFIVVL